MTDVASLERQEQPIVALATAAGAAGVAVLRLSGTGCFAVADRVVRRTKDALPVAQRPAGTFFHARIVHPATGEVLDDAVVLVFRAPSSYTGEDTVEIQCHGGSRAPARVLAAVLAAGARPAEPGEFTRRAFLNGRMDLTQAEAVADLIQARTERAAKSARAQLDGMLGRRIDAVYDRLTDWCADIEHSLDFDDGELPDRFFPELLARAAMLLPELAELAATRHAGHLVREGALAVICGRPNAGKSSLFNVLLGRRRAIVNAQAGTTRDAIEESFVLAGIQVRLVDTAGLRETACAIEREGVDSARGLIARADLLIYVADAAQPLSDAEQQEIAALPGDRLLWVWNKIDLSPVSPSRTPPCPVAGCVSISLADAHVQRAALAALHDALPALLGVDAAAPVETAVGERHARELDRAIDQLQAAERVLAQGGLGLVPAAEHAREAAEALGRIVGRVYSDDLLERVFSRFCVGK